MRISRITLTCLSLLGILYGAAGCDSLGDILVPRRVTVRLVNPGDFPVDVNLYYDDEQDTIEAVLEEFGENIDVTVNTGDTFTFSRQCDDLQAIFIEDADVRVIGSIGPSSSTDIYRDGDDFRCGDTLTFTFEYATIPTSLDIRFSAN